MGPGEGGKLDIYVTQSGERGLMFKQVRCWSGCLPMLIFMCSKEPRSTTSQQASREGGCTEPVWCCAGALRVLTPVHGALFACMNKNSKFIAASAKRRTGLPLVLLVRWDPASSFCLARVQEARR